MQPDYMIKFELDQDSGSVATDEETIIIGFSTQEKKGTLMLIRNDDTAKPEYISVEMNNRGKFHAAGFGEWKGEMKLREEQDIDTQKGLKVMVTLLGFCSLMA